VLTGLAFSDFSITGIDPANPSDEGKVFGKGIAKVAFTNSENVQLSLECEVRGTTGVLGVGGRVGLKKTW
jgi:hypothetical protein